MTKQIAIFIDGTGNRGGPDCLINTNVYKLCQCVDNQFSEYIEGIGEDPLPSRTSHFGQLQAWCRGRYAELLGVGATEKVQRAYLYLASHYTNNDQVFLFGFSRGAFIAKMLAGFIHHVGLLFKHHAISGMVEKAFALYCADNGGEAFKAYVRRMEAAAGAKAEGIVTHFLGQWDTVETLSFFGITDANEVLLRDVAARERCDPLPVWIRNACHAVALHEARQPYEPTLWSGVSEKGQKLQQVWFAGSHSDVGGGFANNDGAGSRYSDIALRWMCDEAQKAGLKMFLAPSYEAPRDSDVPHIPPAWKYGGFPDRLRPGVTTIAQRDSAFEYIHDSALARYLMPIESSYRQVYDHVVNVWLMVDDICLQAHFAQCFGFLPLPVITRSSVVLANTQLLELMAGRSSLLKHEAELALSLWLSCFCQPNLLRSDVEISHVFMHSVDDAVQHVKSTLRAPSGACGAIVDRHRFWRIWLEQAHLELSLSIPRIPFKLERKGKI